MHSEMKLIREKNIFTYSTCIAKTKLYMVFFRGGGSLYDIQIQTLTSKFQYEIRTINYCELIIIYGIPIFVLTNHKIKNSTEIWLKQEIHNIIIKIQTLTSKLQYEIRTIHYYEFIIIRVIPIFVDFRW
jgi:hypothetical protein